MNDKEIFRSINKAVQPPAGVCFENIKARIEAQSDEERESSRKETLRMMENQSNGYSFRRIASFAASISVVLGLGVLLVAMGIGSANSDMAATESIMEDAVVNEYYEEINDGADVPCSDFVAEESAPSDNTAALPETMETQKENAATADTVSQSDTENRYTTHSIALLGLNIDLPADAYITDRNVPNDFELLEIYDISAAQLEANYMKRDIYYNAVWYDADADVTEIVVRMIKDKASAEIFDMNCASEEQLAEIEKLYGNYEINIDAVVGAHYNDVTLCEHEQALFFRAEGMVKNRSGRSNHLQYMTIINGCRIEITLIEHFGIENELSGDEPEKVSEKHEETMEHIIGSVRWEKVRNGFWHNNRGIIFYGLIAAAGLVAIIAVLLLPENRKKKSPGEAQNNTAETLPVNEAETADEAETECVQEDVGDSSDTTDESDETESE